MGSKNVHKAKEKVIVNCTKCGKNHKLNECLAFEKICAKCSKKNHFAAVCKSSGKKKINEIENEQGKVDILITHDKEGYLFIGAIDNEHKVEKRDAWIIELEINNAKIKFKVDTGAMCNVVSIAHLKAIGLKKRRN